MKVNCTATTDRPGFLLRTRYSDLNYVLKIQATSVDAEDKVWTSVIFLTIVGKVIVLGDDIKQLLKDCNDWFRKLSARFAKSHKTQPGDTHILNAAGKFREDIVASFRRGEVGISATLREAVAEIGELQPVANLIVGGKVHQ